MLEVLPAPHHVAAFHFEKTLTVNDYAKVEAEVENRLAKHPRIGVYADLSGLRVITPRALYRDLRYSFGKFSEWDRFSRNAIVSDSRPLRAAVELVGRLVPQVELHTFTTDQRTAALAWAAELPDPASQPAALRTIATTRADTFALAWRGKLTAADMKFAMDVLKPAFESLPSVRLLLRIEDFGGVEPVGFLQSGMVALKQLAFHKLERYAVVGGPAWLARYTSVVGALTAIDIRHFKRELEQDAWAWLEAEAAESQQEIRA